MLTKEQIDNLLPIDRQVEYKFSISGLCMFLAQCDHESMGFSVVEENLSYSKDGLLATFGKYFDEISAIAYARDKQMVADIVYANKQMIANIVYANRMGNGDVESGDGYKYRGRGYIQLTGKNNYRQCGDYLGLALLDNPDLLCLPENGMDSALWFFDTNNLINQLDITKVTKKINGGVNGLHEREILFNKYKKLYKL